MGWFRDAFGPSPQERQQKLIDELSVPSQGGAKVSQPITTLQQYQGIVAVDQQIKARTSAKELTAEESQRVTSAVIRNPRRLKESVYQQWYGGQTPEAIAQGLGIPGAQVLQRPSWPNLSALGRIGSGQLVEPSVGAKVSTYYEPWAEFVFVEGKGNVPTPGTRTPIVVGTLAVTPEMSRRKIWFGIDYDGSYKTTIRGKFNGEVKAEYPFDFAVNSGYFTAETLVKFSIGASIAPTGVVDDEAMVWKTPTVGNFQKLLPYRSNQMIDTWEFVLQIVIPRTGLGPGDTFIGCYSEYPY